MAASLRHAGWLAAACIGLGVAFAVTAWAADEPVTEPLAEAPAEAPPEDAPPVVPPAPGAPFAELRALNKVTARVTTLYIPVGEQARFGTLEITPAVCVKRPPEDPPESAAFLAIVERRGEEPPVDVFRGWMFASSPGLSAMEHPVYDVWVLDCPSSVPSDAAKAPSGGSP